MKRLTLLIAALGLAIGLSGLPVAAQADTAPTLTGKWTMSLDTPQGAMTQALVFKQEGKKVTGTMEGPNGPAPLTGEFADSKLSFSISFAGGGGDMQLMFTGKLENSDSVTGTMTTPMGELVWKATRVKEAK